MSERHYPMNPQQLPPVVPAIAPASIAPGTKHDSDKPRWDLLPHHAVAQVVAVLSFGAQKYSRQGSCSCGALAATQRKESTPPRNVAPVTTGNSRSEIQRTQQGNERTPERGPFATPTESLSTKQSGGNASTLTPSTAPNVSPNEFVVSTDYPPKTTPDSLMSGAPFAEEKTGFASTMTTPPVPSAAAYATHATSDSVSLNDPKVGLNEHSPTCDVHRTIDGADNWRAVQGWRWRYYAAAWRHAVAWWLGERHDPESGLHHLAHAACCMLFLLELDMTDGGAR